jgi:hypothetical protein
MGSRTIGLVIRRLVDAGIVRYRPLGIWRRLDARDHTISPANATEPAGLSSTKLPQSLTSRRLTAVDSAVNVDADAGRAVLRADLRQHRRANDERADATTQASRFLQTLHCTVTRARARSRFIQLPPPKYAVLRAHLCRDLARLVPLTLSDKVCYSHPCCPLVSVSRNLCLGPAHSTMSLMISRWCSFASTT